MCGWLLMKGQLHHTIPRMLRSVTSNNGARRQFVTHRRKDGRLSGIRGSDEQYSVPGSLGLPPNKHSYHFGKTRISPSYWRLS